MCSLSRPIYYIMFLQPLLGSLTLVNMLLSGGGFTNLLMYRMLKFTILSQTVDSTGCFSCNECLDREPQIPVELAAWEKFSQIPKFQHAQ